MPKLASVLNGWITVNTKIQSVWKPDPQAEASKEANIFSVVGLRTLALLTIRGRQSGGALWVAVAKNCHASVEAPFWEILAS